VTRWGGRWHVLRMEAAASAALAEAGLLFLPLMEFSAESVKASGGPLRTYGVVAPLFVIGVVAGLSVRRFRLYLWTAAALGTTLGVVQAVAWGDGDPPGTAFLVVLCLLATLRMTSLSARDWREPVKTSFALGSALALIEVLAAGSAVAEWRALLPFVIVVFFAGSLASRGASVMLAGAGEADPSPGAERRRRASPVVLLAVLGAVLALSVPLGGRHGLFRTIGGFAAKLIGVALLGLAYVTARILLQPLDWVLTRLHISLAPLQRLIRSFVRPPVAQARAHPLVNVPWVERLIGLAVLAVVAMGVIWLIGRLRVRRAPRAGPAPAKPAPALAERLPGHRTRLHRPRAKRELPADLVRRWYAEALLLLERRGLAKPAAVTPSEYLGDVARAFPATRAQFESLTRAYEDVRYGGRTVPRSAVQELDMGRRSMMEVLRRSERADRPPDEPGGEETTE